VPLAVVALVAVASVAVELVEVGKFSPSSSKEESNNIF